MVWSEKINSCNYALPERGCAEKTNCLLQHYCSQENWTWSVRGKIRLTLKHLSSPLVLEDATAGCKASSEEPWGPPRPCLHRETHHLHHVVEVRRTLGVEEESLPVYQESRNEECAQTLNTKTCVEVFVSRRFPSEPMWPPHLLVPLANVRMVVTKGQGLETRWLPWPPAVLCRHYFSPQGCQNSR